MSWKDEPASRKQIDLLAKIGIACPKTKGEASELITEQIKLSQERKKSRRHRRHGMQSPIGTGEISYFYGVMDYCDDGNGNTFDMYEDY